MNSIETLTTFLGWCTVINFGLLVFSGLVWITFKEFFSELAAFIFGVTKEEVKAIFFRGQIQYKIAVFCLNLVPFIALQIMA